MLVLQGNPLNQIPSGPAVFSTVWRFPQIREYKVQSSCKVTVLASKMANWQYTHPLSIHVKSPFSLQKWKIGNTPMPLPINVKSALALKMANWQYTHAVTNSWKVCTRSENGKLTIHSCRYQFMKSLHSLWKWQIDNTLMPLPIHVKFALALKMANWQYTHAITKADTPLTTLLQTQAELLSFPVRGQQGIEDCRWEWPGNKARYNTGSVETTEGLQDCRCR